MKPRSKCKVCSACPHGRQRSTVQGVRWVRNMRARSCSARSARSAVGHQSASTVVGALNARSAVGHNMRARSSALMDARSAVGHQSASTVVSALSARSAVGASICEHGRRRSKCKECGGASICEHGRLALYVQGVRWGMQSASTVVSALSARSAVGRSICEHGRMRSICKECGGGSICEHGRERSSARTVEAINNIQRVHPAH